MGAETIGDVSEDPDPVLQLDPEHPVGERLENSTFDELGAPGHEPRLYRKADTRKPAALVSDTIIPDAGPRASHTAICAFIAPLELVSTRGPVFVTATVCSKHADSD